MKFLFYLSGITEMAWQYNANIPTLSCITLNLSYS